MKLPVDLSGSMPGVVDQVAKLGSMAFMCTMMANLFPCLATMDNNELLTNITALGVLVITLVVNVCIQIQTGVVEGGNTGGSDVSRISSVLLPRGYDLRVLAKISSSTIATIYVTFLLFLLIIHVCSSLAILKSKRIIELKYQKVHETASKDVREGCQDPGQSDLPIMIASQGTSRPTRNTGEPQEGNSQSTRKLLTVEKLQQLVSNYWIMAGSGSPQFIMACSATTTASGVSIQSIRNHIKVFKVEKYWTHKLYDWKYGIIPFPFHSCKRELKEGVVVLCKIIALIPFCLMICVLYSLRFLKWSLQAIFRSREKKTQNLEQRKYVLQLEDENELADRTLEGLLKTFNRLIQKSEKKQPKSLMTLILENSTEGFQGVKIFHRDGPHVQRSLSKVEYRDCWSLPVVTLTTIAVTLPNIDKVKVKSLLKSVREGLQYVTLVEETLNATDDHYKSIQKASKVLWEEVDFRHKWLGIKLKDIVCQVNKTAYQVDTTPQNVQLFFEKAKNMINEGVGSTDIEGPDGYSEHISICAYSMFRITETIIDDTESHKKLFDELSSRIADIMAACLTNLPHVIAKKCHTSVIEKREASVQVATKLLVCESTFAPQSKSDGIKIELIVWRTSV
ncbi:hypothetical protein HanIR_Chr12g0563701 [Helianthus annuus]|nr:hypothetical protein HanIR_Chr12g0563701 [Helianthus annuus]